ncbi:ribosome-binding factor A [Candidatus Kaiserbacteria bacterium]|nr:ribosome-binding factor A [Candidatus Kaiserbacteria bacterium]
MSDRVLKVSLLVKDAAADFLNRESNRTSLITVTRANISKDFAKATVFFTVFPDDQQEQVLHFARRKRADFKAYLKSHLRLKRIPFVDFEIDAGEKHRQHIDEISRDIENGNEQKPAE